MCLAMATSPDPQKDVGSGSFVTKKTSDLNNTTVFHPPIDLVNRQFQFVSHMLARRLAPYSQIQTPQEKEAINQCR
jgi:hypothetical protein